MSAPLCKQKIHEIRICDATTTQKSCCEHIEPQPSVLVACSLRILLQASVATLMNDGYLTAFSSSGKVSSATNKHKKWHKTFKVMRKRISIEVDVVEGAVCIHVPPHTRMGRQACDLNVHPFSCLGHQSALFSSFHQTPHSARVIIVVDRCSDVAPSFSSLTPMSVLPYDFAPALHVEVYHSTGTLLLSSSQGWSTPWHNDSEDKQAVESEISQLAMQSDTDSVARLIPK